MMPAQGLPPKQLHREHLRRKMAAWHPRPPRCPSPAAQQGVQTAAGLQGCRLQGRPGALQALLPGRSHRARKAQSTKRTRWHLFHLPVKGREGVPAHGRHQQGLGNDGGEVQRSCGRLQPLQHKAEERKGASLRKTERFCWPLLSSSNAKRSSSDCQSRTRLSKEHWLMSVLPWQAQTVPLPPHKPRCRICKTSTMHNSRRCRGSGPSWRRKRRRRLPPCHLPGGLPWQTCARLKRLHSCKFRQLRKKQTQRESVLDECARSSWL